MTFVWKIACRRLQSSGALARFAEGATSDQERNEINAHLARCSPCQTAVADMLAIASLLQAKPPQPPSVSLAASGNLWSKIEAEVSRTPQESGLILDPLNLPSPSPQEPRLQRFGHWLATPGALPFGTVAAAAVVGMVGIVVYQRTGVYPAERQVVSIPALEDSSITEIRIVPSPGSPLPASARAQGKMTVRPRSAAPVSMAVAEAEDSEITQISRKMPVRRSPTSVSPAQKPDRRTFAAPRPAAPRPPAFQMAKMSESSRSTANVSAYSASASVSAAAPAANAMAETANPPSAAGSLGGGIGGGGFGGSSGGISDERPSAYDSIQSTGTDSTIRLASPNSARARVAPSAVTVARGGAIDSTTDTPGDNVNENFQDVPAVRSFLDIALQQRRQRSLFSYATR